MFRDKKKREDFSRKVGFGRRSTIKLRGKICSRHES